MSTDTITVRAIDPEVAAADFLAVDALLKRVTAHRATARDAVIASFTAAGITEAADVLCSPSHPRSASIDAALRLKSDEAREAVTVLSTSVALADAALLMGKITARQHKAIVSQSDETVYTVQPVTRKVPVAVANIVTAA